MVPSIDQEIRDLHELFGSSRDPEGRAFVPLADAYRRAGDTTRALVLLSEGKARHPDLPAAFLVEGLVRRDLDDGAGAEEAFRRVLELDPDNARALVGLGRVLVDRRGEDPEGEALLQRGLALDPGLEAVASPDADGGAGSPDAVRSPPADASPHVEGLVDAADLAPEGFDVAEGGDGLDAADAFDLDEVDEVETAEWVDVDEVEVAGEFEVEIVAGEPPDSDEGPGSASVVTLEFEGDDEPASELEIEWEPEASFEPFDAGLYGARDDLEAEAEVPEAAPLPTGDVDPADLLMELSDLAPDLEPGRRPDEEDGDDEAVLPTRTLGDLYARQGLLAEAVEVYTHLVEATPDDPELQARLRELRAESEGGGGLEDHPGDAADEPSVREVLTRLLAWEPDGGAVGADD